MSREFLIPDELVARIAPLAKGCGQTVEAWILGAVSRGADRAIIEEYKSGQMTADHMREILGFETQVEVDAFLKLYA